MSKLRFDVVQDAFKKKAVPAESPAERTSKYFGELVFDRELMTIVDAVDECLVSICAQILVHLLAVKN